MIFFTCDFFSIAFSLRQYLDDLVPRETKLSKRDTLQLASLKIAHLTHQLHGNGEAAQNVLNEISMVGKHTVFPQIEPPGVVFFDMSGRICLEGERGGGFYCSVLKNFHQPSMDSQLKHLIYT